MNDFAYVITVDGGTTNTRAYLSRGDELLASVGQKIGAGCGDKAALSRAVGDLLQDLLRQTGVPCSEIKAVAVSGMLTSELGLYTLPHLPAPAGIAELHAGMKTVSLPEVFPLPLTFLPGVKVGASDPALFDTVRGEETEFFGLPDADGDTLTVLPGSHTKLLFSDSEGRITGIETFLSGEATAALSAGTVLRHSVSLDTPLVEEALKEGYALARKDGFSRALFKVRTHAMCGADTATCTSLFRGILLSGEVGRILETDRRRIAIGGQAQMKEALALLLRAESKKEILCYSEQTVRDSVRLGALRIWRGEPTGKE